VEQNDAFQEVNAVLVIVFGFWISVTAYDVHRQKTLLAGIKR
jgi:hypothetical protein